jgi:hypothetical protein
MSAIRDALRIQDPRLSAAATVVLLLRTIDFFSRVALFPPDSSRPVIEEVETLSNAVPQISQPQADSYLSNIAGLMAVPIQNEAAQLSDDIGARRQRPTTPADGYWAVGDLSYKLIALVENIERFAVLYGQDNESGGKELIELRRGDSIAGYTVSEVLSKRLRLTSDNGDQITLSLFEPEESQD